MFGNTAITINNYIHKLKVMSFSKRRHIGSMGTTIW